MTPAEPNEVAESAPTAPEPTAATWRAHQYWPWLIVLLLAAIVGLVVGAAIVLRGRSFGAARAADVAARPTFVVSAQPSPSLSGSPRPAALPSSPASDDYEVKAGDSLRSIAEQIYGDATKWPRIYDANRQTIGPDPDALNAGTRLRIPPP